MEGLVTFEHLSGTPGQVWAILKFKMGKRKIEMIKTITFCKLPHEFSGTYEADGGFNIVKKKFVQLSDREDQVYLGAGI